MEKPAEFLDNEILFVAVLALFIEGKFSSFSLILKSFFGNFLSVFGNFSSPELLISVNPRSLNLIECRIYQNLDIEIDRPTGDVIQEYIDKIKNRTEMIKMFLEREGR